LPRIAGSYSSQAIDHVGTRGELIVNERSPKAGMWGLFAFHLFQMALFFGSAYSAYSRSSGLAWLLGILLVYSFLDRQFFMKPNLMSAYLAFTVIYYYSRWVMGWGNSATTIYSEDAPTWVKVFKDVVWVGFFAVFAFKAVTRPRINRHMPLWFTPRGMALVFLTVIYFFLPTLSLIYARGKMSEIILLDMRYPLEYVPFVIIFPFVLQGESSIKYLRTFIPLILLSLLFLGVEMFSGIPTGFGGLGLYVRYGSIFGSPNDFGVFLMLSITTLLAFLAERAIRVSLKLVALLTLCLGALASTISLSSIFAMIFSTVTLVLFAKDKVKSALTVLGIVVLAAGLYFAFPDAGVSKYLSERVESLWSLQEGSAYQHYTNVVLAEEAIKRFEPAEYLVGTFQSRKDLLLPETYYLRTFYVRGGVSLLLLLSITGLSLFEANRRYRAAKGFPVRRGLFLAAFLGVAGIAFACLFIPYLETFPSNFYFWFLVAIIWAEPMNEREVGEFHAGRPSQQIAGKRAQVLAPRPGS
jgi:ABC-type multidrug transport system fused ATPase/permease subunit